MKKETKEVTFSMTNKYGYTWTFNGYNYCFQGEASYISLFYSQIEDLWAIVKILGWVKVNGKVVETIVYIENNCVIDFESISYIFTFHRSQSNGCSKTLSNTISSSDKKRITKPQVMFFLKNIKKFLETESLAVYDILQKNKIFMVKEDVWELNYYHYGLHKHYLISDILKTEYSLRSESESKFRIFEVPLKPSKDTKYPNETSKGDEIFIDVIDSDLQKLNTKDKRFKPFDSCASKNSNEISWTKLYFVFPNIKNLRKRKLPIEESVKRKCLYKFIDEDGAYPIKCLLEHPELPNERSSFTADISSECFKRGRSKHQRSYSLIEENDKENEDIWTVERRSKDDNFKYF